MGRHLTSIYSKFFVITTSIFLISLVLFTPLQTASQDEGSNQTRSDGDESEFGQYGPVWWRTFGGVREEDGSYIQPTNDGGYIIVGWTESYGEGLSDLWLFKTNETGHEEWNRTYGGKGVDFGNSMVVTGDGDYILTGVTTSYGSGMMDLWLIKVTKTGEELWNRTYGGKGDDKGVSIIQADDGGYAIAGTTTQGGPGWANVWLLKTNDAGSEEWNITFNSETNDEAYSVAATGDDGYIITGSTKTYGAGKNDIWLIKINGTGGEEWNVTFGGPEDDIGNAVIHTSDGGFMVIGQTQSFGATDIDFYGILTDDIWLIKTDSEGKEQWNRTIGDKWYEFGEAIIQTSDGGYVIAGNTGSYPAENFQIILVKIDSEGKDVWYKGFGGKDYDFGNSMIQTSEGDFVICGSVASFGAGGTDLVLLKFDPKVPVMVQNQPPTVSISSPSENEKISGLYKIQGTVADDGYYFLVLVKFDNESWVSVSEDKSWFFFWNTSRVENGEHTIYARAFDAQLYSENASVTVFVDNGPGGDDDDNDKKTNEEEVFAKLPWVLIAIIVVVVLIIILIVIVLKKSKRS
jgi:hypothetical protein